MELENVIELETELEASESIELEIETAGPQGPKGDPGYTPIKGEDYWTEEDQTIIKNDLKDYIDNQLGVIENGAYW